MDQELVATAVTVAEDADQEGLTAADVAGPVDTTPSAAALSIGDSVEVRTLSIGVRGCWLPALIKKANLVTPRLMQGPEILDIESSQLWHALLFQNNPETARNIHVS